MFCWLHLNCLLVNTTIQLVTFRRDPGSKPAERAATDGCLSVNISYNIHNMHIYTYIYIEYTSHTHMNMYIIHVCFFLAHCIYIYIVHVCIDTLQKENTYCIHVYLTPKSTVCKDHQPAISGNYDIICNSTKTPKKSSKLTSCGSRHRLHLLSKLLFRLWAFSMGQHEATQLPSVASHL